MKITKQELIDGLAALDPKADAHWTEEGAPALQAVQDTLLDDTITREDLNEHANGFTREVAADAIVQADVKAKVAVLNLQNAPDLAGVDPLGAPGPLDGEDQGGGKEELEAAVLSAKQALEDHDAAVAKAKLRRDELVAVADRAIRARDAKYPPMNSAEAIQHWLASEARKREARSSQVVQMAAPKSPLDQSMARRTGHGHGRKSIPLMAG